MTKIVKKLLFIGTFLLLATSLNAQDYYTSVGIRAGLTNGLTVKHYISDIDAIEGTLVIREGGFVLTGLYEYVNEFRFDFNTDGLKWFYGFGAHVGYWSGNVDNTIGNFGDQVEGGVTIIGADGVVGVEYTFENFPMNISVDWQPTFNLIGNSGWSGDSIALSLRYIIN